MLRVKRINRKCCVRNGDNLWAAVQITRFQERCGDCWMVRFRAVKIIRLSMGNWRLALYTVGCRFVNRCLWFLYRNGKPYCECCMFHRFRISPSAIRCRLIFDGTAWDAIYRTVPVWIWTVQYVTLVRLLPYRTSYVHRVWKCVGQSYLFFCFNRGEIYAAHGREQTTFVGGAASDC